MMAPVGKARTVNDILDGDDLTYAVSIVGSVCVVAGSPDYLDELRDDFRKLGLRSRNRERASRAAYEWLARAVSYQGISDEVATTYMRDHEMPTWSAIARGLQEAPACHRLTSFWHLEACRYRKAENTCSEPEHFEACPLPRHDFRNGNLNQSAYSLFLFVRDIAGGDLFSWIDAQIDGADEPASADRLEHMSEAIIGPLKGVFGVSDKVLNMAFADFLLGAGRHDGRWAEVGGTMIAVDTLVHNFLRRSGILRRGNCEHPYGPRCYGRDGCAALLRQISSGIDASAFNPGFPAYFPRYVQRTIWQFCSREGLNVCNGVQIDDKVGCQRSDCRLFTSCDRRL